MFKLVVLSTLFALSLARPGLYESSPALLYSAPSYASVTVQESALAHVGDVVKSVPSSVSQHSNSVVHSHAHTVEDVLAPAVKTTSYTTKSFATPVIQTYAAPTYVKSIAAPIVHTYASSPVLYKSW